MSYRRLAVLHQLDEGTPLRCEVGGGRRVALLRLGPEVHAFSDHCTHEEASLSDGFVDGHFVECPKHGSSFDIRTGKVLSLPATRDLAVYPVRFEGDEVWVELEPEEPT